VIVGQTTVTVKGAEPVHVAPVAESVATIVKLNVPAAVGVPERTPAGLSVRPGGSVPVEEKVCGATPPVAVKVCV
jgi:hypothetical protein